MTTVAEQLTIQTSQSELASQLANNSIGIVNIISYSENQPIYNGTIDIFDALTSACASLATYGGRILIPSTVNGSTYYLNTNFTMSSKIELEFVNGATIKIASGKTLTFTNTKIISGLHQIFDLSLGGTIAGVCDNKEVYPEWFGAVGDGITDDTISISKCLNCTISKDVFFSKDTYLLSSVITINDSTTTKKIKGNHKTTFKCTLSATSKLFDMYTNAEFSDITFDFNNSYCLSALYYRASLGTIKLKNLYFNNVKDIDSTSSSILINIIALGNTLDISDLHFDSILKRGNGVLTDSGGSIGCIYYQGSANALGGNIRDCSFYNIHNINASSVIILEDTFGIYLAMSGYEANVNIYNITGYEFGKRLIKNQSSKVYFDNILGEAHSGDTLSVVGSGTETSFAIPVTDVIINNVKCIGLIDYAISVAHPSALINNCDIKLYGSNALNHGESSFAILLGNVCDNVTIQNCIITSKRCIGLYNLTSAVSNIKIQNIKFTTLVNSIALLTQDTSTYGYDNLEILDCQIIGNPLLNNISGVAIISNTAPTNKNKNLSISNVKIFASDDLVGTYTYSNILIIRGTDNIRVRNISYINSATTVFLSDAIYLKDCSYVDIDDVVCLSPSNRLLFADTVDNLKIGKCTFGSSSTIGQIIIKNSTAVELHPMLEQYKIVYGSPQTETEVLRSYGTTAERPTYAYKNYEYFDTTLSYPVWYTGSVWKNAAGTTV